MKLTIWHTPAILRSYSRDLRERLLQARASGLSAAEIERTIGVSARTAGLSLEPGQASRRPRRIASTEDDQLRAQVAAHPDATLAEQCARWAETTDSVPVSRATMCRALRRLDLSLKTRP